MTVNAIQEAQAAEALPGLIDRATAALNSARNGADVLEARDMALVAYDAARSAGRMAKTKQAHDEVLGAVYRAQADAALIEARAKMRLADEYDAAQERGAVAGLGDNQHRPEGVVDTERRDAGADLETRSDREYAELLGRFELRQVALALDEGRALSGATKEVVDELRSKGGYQGVPVPLAALETRAGETVSADQINPKAIRPVIDGLFPASVASRLAVQSINITSGELEFPVATAGAVFGWQTTELANVGAASEYQTSERSLNPDHTGGAQMVISRKALKQAGEGLESAIRRDLNAVIGTELDRVVVNGSGAAGQPRGFIPGAVPCGITSTPVGAAATWAAFRAQVVAFMEANAITSASQVNLGFGPEIWAELDDALISGTAVSEWDRLTKHVASPAISNVIPAETAILTATVQGIAPGYLGIYGGVDLIRDPYTKAASGQLVLTALVTADFTVPRGLQTRILTGIGAP